MEDREVTTVEILYLSIVIGAGTVFALTLGYMSWEYDKHKED